VLKQEIHGMSLLSDWGWAVGGNAQAALVVENVKGCGNGDLKKIPARLGADDGFISYHAPDLQEEELAAEEACHLMIDSIVLGSMV
jgi:hypothetical protein